MKNFYFLLFTFFISISDYGQTVIFEESFEIDGQGTRYFTSVPEFSDGSGGDFFVRTDGLTNVPSYYEIIGQHGTQFFAAMDTNGDGQPKIITLSFLSIDISTYTDLTFAILAAEDDSSDGLEDWDADTSVLIETNIDGAGWTNLMQFSGGDATNTEPGLDTNFDGVADSVMLTPTFQEFTASVGTGSSLDIRITFTNLDDGDEDFAMDNVRLIDGFVSCTVELGNASYSCEASTTNASDGVVISIPYAGSDNTITSVSSNATVGGDNPATVSNGTIIITGLSEGNSWNITLNGGACDGRSLSGTVPFDQCLPTPCYDLSGTNQFDIIQNTANDEMDNWSFNGGEYFINGFCNGCTNKVTDSYLISGPLDMSSATNVELVLTANEGFSGTDLIVYYTDIYSGNPDTTLWTIAQSIASGSEGYFIISIPSTGSEVYIGIQYLDEDVFSSWTLSNVGIYADSCPTLSNEKNEITGFSMYPNPTSKGYVNISSKFNTEMSVTVYDILGKQVLKSIVKENILDVSVLNSGLYILKATQNDAVTTRRLIIK